MEKNNSFAKHALTALNRVPVPLLAFDAKDKCVALANERFRHVFGYGPAELEDVEAWWREAVHGGEGECELISLLDAGLDQALAYNVESGPVRLMIKGRQGEVIPARMLVSRCDGLIIMTLEDHVWNGSSQRDRTACPARDPQTGFANRAAFLTDLEQGLSLAARHGHPLYLVAAGIDSLDAVAENHGEDARDALLRHYAAIVRHTLRRSDVAGRLGLEEFAFMLPETHRSGALRLVERLRQALQEERFDYGGEPVHYSVDYALTGLRSEMPWQTPDKEQLVNMAGNALKQAREAKHSLAVAEQYQS
ncbi:MAG: sensor domain-containing diguanylate cyclase [Thermodesulfobacteriota bacterium]